MSDQYLTQKDVENFAKLLALFNADLANKGSHGMGVFYDINGNSMGSISYNRSVDAYVYYPPEEE